MKILLCILWVLLGVLALLLVLLALVMFVPVRYRANGEYEKKLSARGRLTWLLHIVSLSIDYDNSIIDYKLRVFGIPFKKGQIDTSKDKEEAEGKEKEKKSKKKENKAKEKKGKRRFGRKRKKQDTNGMSRVERFLLKLSNLCDDLGALKRTVESDTTRRAFSFVCTQAATLFKMAVPRKLNLYLKYGTGDAYSLANALIGLSVIYGLYGDHIDIEPDWDNEVLIARGDLKGRIILFTLTVICIKVLVNGDIKKLKKRLESFSYIEEEGEENGRERKQE